MPQQNSSTPAADAVFATSELLEQILSSLEMKDPFVVQRVCVKWRAVIRNSLCLRQKMYLAPSSVESRWRQADVSEHGFRLTKINDGDTGNDEEGIITSGHLNDCILQVLKYDRGDMYQTKAVHGEMATFRHVVEDSVRPNSLLTNCFLTQPPAGSVVLRYGTEEKELHNAGGVTLGDIMREWHEMNDGRP